MSGLRPALGCLLAVGVVIGLAAAAYFGAVFLVGQLSELGGGASTALVTVVVTLLVSTRMIANAIRGSKIEEGGGPLLQRRADVYLRLIDKLSNAPGQSGAESDSSAGRRDVASPRVEGPFLLLASSGVVKQCAALRGRDPTGDAEARAELEKLILKMRKDLGQSNVGLPPGSLLGLLP